MLRPDAQGHRPVGEAVRRHAIDRQIERPPEHALTRLGFEPARKQVHRRAADECRDEDVRRRGIDRGGRSHLLDRSPDASARSGWPWSWLRPGHGSHRSWCGRRACAGARARVRISTRSSASRFDKRLVHQEGERLAHDRAAERHALALPAGELVGISVQLGAELQQARRRLHLGGLIASRATPLILSGNPRFSRTVICG